MNRAVFKYIEFELYNYDTTKKKLADFRNGILDAGFGGSIINPAGEVQPESPTERRAMKLLTPSVSIMRMEQVVNAVEKALQMLGEQHKKLFDLKYKQGMHPWKICEEMHISERTYYRMRRDIVIEVGRLLGLEVD